MRIFFITAVALLICSLPGQPLMAKPLFRIAYPDTENAPRALGNSIEVPVGSPGISIELMQLVGKKLGIQVEFDRAPWKRCLYLVEQGMVDGVFHASYKPDRARYGVYPNKNGSLDPERAIYINRYAVYLRRDSGVGWDGKAFHNLTLPIGVMQGAAGGADLRKLNYPVAEERNVPVNFDKLQAGRISAYVEIETIGDSFLAANQGRYPEIKKQPIPFKEKVYYLLISKKFYQQHPELSEAVYNAIRDVKKEAPYQSMVKKYN